VHRRRRTVRKWRSRGRRGQVAAVATILGLLLVVTFIANYLTTTLPNQMSVNDLDHVLQVENQMGQFQALLEQVSAQDAIGAQVTQPVTLGSSGLPPFADADSGAVGPLNGSSYSLSFVLAGPPGDYPPTGGTPNSGYLPASAGCVPATSPTTTLVCTGGGVTWNFSAASPTTYTVTTGTGSDVINITDSGASSSSKAAITLAAAGTSPEKVLVLGSNDTVAVASTAATTFQLEVVGNNDTVTVGSLVGATTMVAYVVGVDDAVNFAVSIGSAVKFIGTFFGFGDSVNAGTATVSGNVFSVYFNGFNPAERTAYCPIGNLAASTDTVSGGTSGKGTYSVTFNDTTTTTGSVSSPWTGHWPNPALFYCPFYSTITVGPHGTRSAGVNVHLLNTYAPQADIGFDAGAIVFAQPGGVPILLDPPGLSVVESASAGVTSASIWLPVFTGTNASEAGISTTVLSARLIAETNLALSPTSDYGIANDTDITFSVTTPFVQGWWSYYNATYPSTWISCVGHGCNGEYTGLGDFGTITLTIPTGVNLNVFDLDIATFGFSLI
jgi:hypothetical protein